LLPLDRLGLAAQEAFFSGATQIGVGEGQGSEAGHSPEVLQSGVGDRAKIRAPNAH
jgi:hypothetical protein